MMNASGVQQVSSSQVRIVNSLSNAVIVPVSTVVSVSSSQQKVLQPLQTTYSGQPLILTLANHNGDDAKNCESGGGGGSSRLQQVIYQPQQNYSEYGQYAAVCASYYQGSTSSSLQSTPGIGATQIVSQGGENYIVHSGSLDVNGQIAHTIRASPATVGWLLENYETAESVSLPRSTLYNHYIRHCTDHKLDPMNPASFGKLIRSVFPGLRTRRLGTRGNSQYHYYGIRIKSMSTLNQLGCDGLMTSRQQSVHQAKRFKSEGEDGNVSTSDSSQPSQSAASGLVTSQHQQHMQYLGDTSAALPDFGHVLLAPGQQLPVGITLEHVLIFEQIYRDHCEAFMEIVITLQFHLVETLWMSFWRKVHTNHDGDEADRQLSMDKLYALCELGAVQQYIQQTDYCFYQAIVRILIPDVLRPIPSQLTQAIRNFAKNLETWLKNAMAGTPDEILKIKVNAVRAFAQILRRYTSLNHLAQAARAVLQNSNQISQMLADINKVDFTSVQEQASWVCHCDDNIVRHLEQDFKRTLQQQTPLEQWAAWLEDVVNEALAPYTTSADFPKAARQFLLKWSFYSSMVIRDLTLRSAASFGSFHLIRLLYDEYMFYLVEHKVATAVGETSIAVMAEFRQMIDMGSVGAGDMYGVGGLGDGQSALELTDQVSRSGIATSANYIGGSSGNHGNDTPYLAMTVESETTRPESTSTSL